MKFKVEDLPGIKTPTDTTIKMLIHPESTGKPSTIPLSMLMVILPPGTIVREHCHPTCDEYEYFVTGRGILYRSGKEVGPVEPNTVVYNSKGTLHQIKNTGNETMFLLRIHIPPLPCEGQIKKAIDLAKVFFKKNLG